MADIDLRQLEREAVQGNVYAIKRLVFAQLRAGLEPYKSFFMRFSTNGTREFQGIPLTLHENGRFVPELPGIEDGYFFHHFLVNDEDAELILARSVVEKLVDLPENLDQLPPFFQNLEPWQYEDLQEDFFQGLHIIEDINFLGTLKLNQLYHPHEYNKSHIQEYEEAPAYPEQDITALIKKPGEEPALFHTRTSPNFIEELLGEDSWTSVALKWLSPKLRMYCSEFPKGRTNFGLKIPANVSEATRERILKMIEEDKADPGILDFMQPRIELIQGPAVFLNTSVPETESINWNQLPWPWNEIAKDKANEWWPTSTEFTKLSDEDIELALSAITPIPIQLPGPATHFTPSESGAIIYDIDDCEKCGGITQINAVQVNATRAELVAAGLIELETLPSELGYSEEFGGAVCEDCY
jgi:hypothetical protein